MIALLDRVLALGVRRFFKEEECRAWVASVYAARDAWNSDFGGEQFSLGRAFYTHLEQGRSRAYFGDARGSDARVERALPGLQGRMRALVARLTGGHEAARRDGRDEVDTSSLSAPSVIAPYGVGDVIAIDSYPLHQIQPFAGARDRISVTVRAAEIDAGAG